MNRYEILLGKKPPPAPPKWRPVVITGFGKYFPGSPITLTKFDFEIAKAKRICTHCRETINASDPCLKAHVVDQTNRRGKFWSNKVQLCPSCIQKGRVQEYLKKFKSMQDPEEILSDFQEGSDKLKQMHAHIKNSRQGIKGSQPSRTPSGVTGIWF